MTIGRIAGPATAMLAAFAVSSPAIAFAEPARCGADEEVLFACPAAKKTLSVCAQKGWTRDSGRVTYRYGTAERAELVLPEAPSSPSASATAGTLAFSDSGGASLRFHGPRADYIVYSAVSGQWGERSGVAVERDGKPLANVRCTGRTTSQLGPALFERADFAHDERFVLPEE